MKLFPIGTSRLHEPLSFLVESGNVNFPGLGYFHSPSQIFFLIDLLCNRKTISANESRFFFRKDQTPPNQFQASIWHDCDMREVQLERAQKLFVQSDVLVIEVSTLKTYMANGIPSQGNPNFYHNIPYSIAWKQNYYHLYHPEIDCIEIDESNSIDSFFYNLNSYSIELSKPIIIVGHLVDPKNPNSNRLNLNRKLKESSEKYESIYYYDASHLISKFGFRVLENGSIDIHHLPWEALETQAEEIINIADSRIKKNKIIMDSEQIKNKSVFLESGDMDAWQSDITQRKNFGIDVDLEELEFNIENFLFIKTLEKAEEILSKKPNLDIDIVFTKFYSSIKLCSSMLESMNLKNLARKYSFLNWVPIESEKLFEDINKIEILDRKVDYFFSHFNWLNPSNKDASNFSNLFISSARYNPYLYNILQTNAFITSRKDDFSYIRCMFRLGRNKSVLTAINQNNLYGYKKFYFNLALAQSGIQCVYSNKNRDELIDFNEYDRLNLAREKSILKRANKTSKKISSTFAGKIAVCVSGQLRGHKHCLRKWINNIHSLSDADLYISTWDTNPQPLINTSTMNRFLSKSVCNIINETPGIENHSLEQIFSSLGNNDLLVTEEYLQTYNPKKVFIKNEIEFENECKEKYGQLNRHTLNQLKMFYQMNACFQLLENNQDYDLVIRIRPDLGHSNITESILTKAFNAPNSVGVLMNQVDGIDDKFAIMDMDTAEIYASIWPDLYASEDLNYLFLDRAKFAESLLLRHLYSHGINPYLILGLKYGGLINEKYDDDTVKNYLFNLIENKNTNPQHFSIADIIYKRMIGE